LRADLARLRIEDDALRALCAAVDADKKAHALGGTHVHPRRNFPVKNEKLNINYSVPRLRRRG
jgi:hypothetical protein